MSRTGQGKTPTGKTGGGYLTGQLLLAMPLMDDPRFAKSVIYVCAHSEEGAMGIVINRALTLIDTDELFAQLGIPESEMRVNLPIHFGGPVETARGFVLHSADFRRDDTLMLEGGLALTGTIDILKEIALGRGPDKSLFALGYAGWGPGQLETELQANAWLSLPADKALIFDTQLDDKWSRALKIMGIDPAMLSGTAGRA